MTAVRPLINLAFAISAFASVAARADDDLFPASKNLGHISINLATGDRTINQTSTAPRNGTILWDCTSSPPFYGFAYQYERLDWGDISHVIASQLDAFEIAYCSTAYTPDENNGNVTLQLTFYVSEPGHNSPSPPSTVSFRVIFSGLPGAGDPNIAGSGGEGCWIIDANVSELCALDPNLPCDLGLSAAGDFDGDGLSDFGYGIFFPSAGPDSHGNPATSGPLFAYPGPDPVGAPGADLHAYDRYNPPGKWSVGNAGYIAAYDNGAQIWLQFRGASPANCPAPTNPTDCSCADNNNDGHVDLADLAALIANYGATGPNLAGDCASPCGSIDLADLGYTLSRYGLTGCAVP